jgi:hypothetical protein
MKERKQQKKYISLFQELEIIEFGYLDQHIFTNDAKIIIISDITT